MGLESESILVDIDYNSPEPQKIRVVGMSQPWDRKDSERLAHMSIDQILRLMEQQEMNLMTQNADLYVEYLRKGKGGHPWTLQKAVWRLLQELNLWPARVNDELEQGHAHPQKQHHRIVWCCQSP